ncbi:MAG: hypothetical protein AAF732_15055 [Pseudomonadota bacterium]
MWSHIVTGARAFRKDKTGKVAVIFTLAVVVLVIAGGLTMDIARVHVPYAGINAAHTAMAPATANDLRLKHGDDTGARLLAEECAMLTCKRTWALLTSAQPNRVSKSTVQALGESRQH